MLCRCTKGEGSAEESIESAIRRRQGRGRGLWFSIFVRRWESDVWEYRAWITVRRTFVFRRIQQVQGLADSAHMLNTRFEHAQSHLGHRERPHFFLSWPPSHHRPAGSCRHLRVWLHPAASLHRGCDVKSHSCEGDVSGQSRNEAISRWILPADPQFLLPTSRQGSPGPGPFPWNGNTDLS
jgi:hypothetical protein